LSSSTQGDPVADATPTDAILASLDRLHSRLDSIEARLAPRLHGAVKVLDRLSHPDLYWNGMLRGRA